MNNKSKNLLILLFWLIGSLFIIYPIFLATILLSEGNSVSYFYNHLLKLYVYIFTSFGNSLVFIVFNLIPYSLFLIVKLVIKFIKTKKINFSFRRLTITGFVILGIFFEIFWQIYRQTHIK